MPTDSKIPQAEWDKHKDRLYALYITDDRQLEEVVERAKLELGFFASKAQYIRQFGKGKWDFKKNFRKGEWKAVSQEVSKRKFRDKDSEVWLNNSRVPSKRLRKEISRYGLHTRGQHENEISLDADSGIVVRTPQAEARPFINYMDIPWIHFLNSIEPYIQSMGKLSPQGLAMQLHDAWTVWIARQQGIDLTGSSMTMAPDREYAARLRKQVRTYHEDLAIGVPDPDSRTVRPGSSESLLRLMSFLVYLSSNSLQTQNIGVVDFEALESIDQLVRWLHDSRMERVLLQLLDLKTSTIKMFGSMVFRSAAKLGFTEMVRDLVDMGVDVNSVEGDSLRQTALTLAVIHNRIEIVRLLLQAGADLKPCKGAQYLGSILHLALDGPDRIEMMQTLLQNGADVNEERNEHDQLLGYGGNSILSRAVSRNDHTIVRLLLKAGAHVNPAQKNSSSPLHAAVENKDIEMVQILIGAGADVNRMSVSGMSQMTLGVLPGSVAYEALFATPIQLASQVNNTKIVKMLLDKGADPCRAVHRETFYSDDQDTVQTVLQSAVDHRNAVMVEMLLKAGADVNDRAGHLGPALAIAAANADLKMVRILLRHGSHINAPAGQFRESATALQAAAKTGDLEVVKELLDNGADVNADPGPIMGRTALQAAAEEGNFELVKFLISKGADLNAGPSLEMGVTCLSAAVGQGHVNLAFFLLDNGAHVNSPTAARLGEVTTLRAALKLFNRHSYLSKVDEAEEHSRFGLIKGLIKAGVDLNSPCSPGRSLSTLTMAVQSGQPDLVHFLLENGLHPNPNMNYRSPLGEAVYQGDSNLVRCLINAGTDVDAWYEIEDHHCSRDLFPLLEFGGTPLHVAALKGYVEVAQVLLDAGAEIGVVHHPSRSRTALQYAVVGDNTHMVKFLLDKGANPNVFVWDSPLELGLMDQWKRPNLEIIATLIKAGADTNPTHGHQPTRSLFHLPGVGQGGPELVHLLLESGVSVNGTHDGMSVLQSIAEHNRIEMVGMLLNAGADVNAPAGLKSGRTVLQNATERGDLEMVKLLLSHGVDVNAPATPFYGSRTALQHATARGDLEMVKLLLCHGADVNAPAQYDGSRRALQHATERGDLEMVKLLLSHGADVNAPAGRRYGITALQGAMRKGSLKMVLTLLEAGAHINDVPAAVEGRTALEAAAEWGRLDIVHLLLNNDGEPDTIEARCKRAADFAEKQYHSIIARGLRQHKPKR
ncbi:ankyrin repeat-containing domain protein [Usnea florida]